MTSAVVLRRAARQEFDEAALWYEGRRAGLGSQFTAEVERVIRLVAETPERFPPMHRDVRCVRVRRFPYSVFFRIETTRIVVLAVFHARRNSAIWQRRV
ncbi:MAG TPA: type II toxin-antitoxin system RelE/ParE family toxin [Gammaproteobacteria bacterium]|nr:type II toxin-antitoxin system RelE/ParE family toxin [Gammaproteobacteria bacterium]